MRQRSFRGSSNVCRNDVLLPIANHFTLTHNGVVCVRTQHRHSVHSFIKVSPCGWGLRFSLQYRFQRDTVRVRCGSRSLTYTRTLPHAGDGVASHRHMLAVSGTACNLDANATTRAMPFCPANPWIPIFPLARKPRFWVRLVNGLARGDVHTAHCTWCACNFCVAKPNFNAASDAICMLFVLCETWHRGVSKCGA